MKCYKQPKLTLTLVIILTESTRQHETSPSKGSHSFPLNILEGGESSNIAHDKEQTTILLKYKYFETHLQRAHRSPKTAENISHSATQHRPRQSQISKEAQWLLPSFYRKFICLREHQREVSIRH